MTKAAIINPVFELDTHKCELWDCHSVRSDDDLNIHVAPHFSKPSPRLLGLTEHGRYVIRIYILCAPFFTTRGEH